jgi:hypothetical protein
MKKFPAQNEIPCVRAGPPIIGKDKLLPYFPSESFKPAIILGDTGFSLGKLPGEKNIFWLHGLNGSMGTWARAAYATQVGLIEGTKIVFDARKVNSIILNHGNGQSYSENDGIENTALDLENDAQARLQNTSNRTLGDYIISHSQGGIVGRNWLRQMSKQPQTFQKFAHGLVTFGTPHDGAQILNNTRPDMGNKVPAFMNEACESITNALVLPTINNNLWTRMLLSGIAKSAIKSGCALASNSIIPMVLEGYYKRATLDYYNGSPYLIGKETNFGHEEGLSEYTLKVPVVQFYGEEKQPALWKLMSSTMALGDDSLDNKQIYFGYTNDDQLEKKVASMVNDFDAKYNYEKSQEDSWEGMEISYYTLAALNYFYYNILLGSTYTLLGIGATVKKNAAIDNQHIYSKAKTWLTNANDYYLTDLIGARVNYTVLNCRVVGESSCRDLRYNPEGSGVPPVIVKFNYNYNTTNNYCNNVDFNMTDYHFTGHNGTEWHGPCTGTGTVFSSWKNAYYYKPCDGVVLAESAAKEIKVDKTLPGVTHARIQLGDANHVQMENSEHTKTALDKLYNGKYGSFFEIEKK